MHRTHHPFTSARVAVGTTEAQSTLLFESWLASRCQVAADAGTPIDKARAVRTSADSVTMWLASATTSFAAADRSDPDVAAALALGFDLIRRDAIGETTRADLEEAVFVVDMHHAPGGVGRKNLGVVLHVGSTFFVYLLSSARARNLRAVHEDRRGNAATEVLSMVVRAMASWASRHPVGYRLHLFAREHDRIVRDEQHGASLKSTLKTCRVIAHTPHETDLTKPAEAQHFTFGSMISSGAADASIRGMNRAEIVIQANGGYYEDIRQAPFTHGGTVLVEEDRRSQVEVRSYDKHRLAVVGDVEAARGQLRRLVDRILEPASEARSDQAVTDWEAVGDLMADMGMRSRRPEDLRKGLLLRDLPTRSRVASAQSLFSRRWISGWREGSFEKLVPIKIEMELDLSDLDVDAVVTPDGKAAYRCRIKMPVPEGGWGVTEDEWARVLERRYPTTERPRVYTGNVLPLAGLPEWGVEAEEAQYDLESRTARYVLRSRPLSEATVAGQGRSWEDSSVTKVASIRPQELHADVARAMREALLALETTSLPVVVTARRAAATAQTPAQVQDRRRSELQKQLEEAQTQRNGAVDVRNRALGQHSGQPTLHTAEELEEAEEGVVRARNAVRSVTEQLAALDHEHPSRIATEDEDTAVGVPTGTAEFVAAALEKCEAGAPPWLRDACLELLSDVRVSRVCLPGVRPKLSWSATLTLMTQDADGRVEPVGIPISGSVAGRRNAGGGRPVDYGPEAWAWSFFYGGSTFIEIGKSGEIDGSGRKNTYLYKGLSEWLSNACTGVVPHDQLRAAALDCPIPATRRIFWSMGTGDHAALAGIDEGFVDHIRTVYSRAHSRRRWSWCSDTHQLARLVARELCLSGGVAPRLQIAAALGVAPAKLNSLVKENGKPTKGAGAKNPAPAALSPFLKSWKRGEPWTLEEEKTISLRPCPHRDCPQRLRGGSPFASHVVLVPETEAGFGVLCPHCLRLPVGSLSHVRFPADYLRPWSGRFGYGSHAGAREHAGSHIDPMFDDAGPASALPETGARPRPEVRVNRPGNYLAKHLRSEPLGGARVLLLDLPAGAREELEAEVTRLGGRLATKVTRSLPYVVAANRGLVVDRALRAQEFGAQVMGVGEFRRLLLRLERDAAGGPGTRVVSAGDGRAPVHAHTLADPTGSTRASRAQ